MRVGYRKFAKNAGNIIHQVWIFLFETMNDIVHLSEFSHFILSILLRSYLSGNPE